jgi:hypothetical protein
LQLGKQRSANRATRQTSSFPPDPVKLWRAAAASETRASDGVRFSANVTLPRESAAKVDELLLPGALALVIATESSGLRNTSGTSSMILGPDAQPNR